MERAGNPQEARNMLTGSSRHEMSSGGCSKIAGNVSLAPGPPSRMRKPRLWRTIGLALLGLTWAWISLPSITHAAQSRQEPTPGRPGYARRAIDTREGGISTVVFHMPWESRPGPDP